MKKLINHPDDVVREALEGLAAAHPETLRVNLRPAYVVRTDAPLPGKVGVLSGGNLDLRELSRILGDDQR